MVELNKVGEQPLIKSKNCSVEGCVAFSEEKNVIIFVDNRQNWTWNCSIEKEIGMKSKIKERLRDLVDLVGVSG